MSRPLFTQEELAELAAADAELDESFVQTQEEIVNSRRRDREAKLDGMDNRKKKIAAQKAAWLKNNREKWSAYQRERRRMKKEEASGCLS